MAPSRINKGSLTNLAIWISFVACTLAVLTKLASGQGRRNDSRALRKIWADDAYIVAAWIAALGMSLALSQEVHYGLGREDQVSAASDAQSLLKCAYASRLLYVVSLGLSSLSAIAFIQTLAVARKPRAALKAVQVVCYLWVVTTFLALAFECKLPSPWSLASGECINMGAFWPAIATIFSVIELGVIALPTYIISKLQTSSMRKMTALSVFIARIIIVGLSSAHAALINRHEPPWLIAVIAVVNVNSSIIISCSIFLKPVLLQMQPGWSQSNIYKGLGFRTTTSTRPADMRNYPLGSVVREDTPPSPARGGARTWDGQQNDMRQTMVEAGPRSFSKGNSSLSVEEDMVLRRIDMETTHEHIGA